MKQLDPTVKQNIKYAVPLWLRDEQIKLAVAGGHSRIEPYPEGKTRSEAAAVVCFGPSLNDTWEEIRKFKYIFTCSGAHKFLIERGIVPTWHCEVDPRPHKVKLIGPPHKDVQYLIASACHPDLFAHLQGFDIKLWHIFADEDDASRVLPYGHWSLIGGGSVGLRALVLARFLGFVNLHIFGMDGNVGPSGLHAAAHPMQPTKTSPCEFEGVTYQTTPSVLECARQTFSELDQLWDVTATFYGEGLVQAMAKTHVYNRKKRTIFVAFQKMELISDDFRELNKQLHRDKLMYGVGGGDHATAVIALAEHLNTTSILDYGCGKGFLSRALPFPIWEYDPAIPGKDAPPRSAELVICTDVLEHIEPDKLFSVLCDIRRCVSRIGYFVIDTGPAKKQYADGRNTHLIQEDKAWWVAQISQFFVIGKVTETKSKLTIVVAPIPS